MGRQAAVGRHVCALVSGGGYAEYCVAPLEQCLPIPASISERHAAAIPETFFTVWTNLFDRAALTRGYARNFETAEQLARAVTNIALYDLPDDYFAQFVPMVERVTPAEITRVASRYLDPERLTTLIVGDYAAFGTLLRVEQSGDKLGLEFIGADAL